MHLKADFVWCGVLSVFFMFKMDVAVLIEGY